VNRVAVLSRDKTDVSCRGEAVNERDKKMAGWDVRGTVEFVV